MRVCILTSTTDPTMTETIVTTTTSSPSTTTTTTAAAAAVRAGGGGTTGEKTVGSFEDTVDVIGVDG
jgi:hypothetical protein